ILNRLIAEVEIRLRIIYSELENMKSWIRVKGCRREYVLQQFGYRKEKELNNCCDYCGITKEDYKKRRAQQSDFDYNWETELQKLFGLEKMGE
ncbi:ATP-dependent DNA helicase RecQ, partial [Bacillus thuringiensis]|nr:ATP-dependent DNA helicase RecQ [Bacillus thuringiensis]